MVKKISSAVLDKGRCSHVENTRPKENARGEDRQNTKANRGATRQKAFSMGLSLDSRA
jgi:hypothetical protein